jgi:DNA mismatch repair ATPase MutS
MINDKITLKDLSIFTSDGDQSVFTLIDFTTTQAGRDVLRAHIRKPSATAEQLIALQDTIKFWYLHPHLWPDVISNGTLVMLEKFFESADNYTSAPGSINLLFGSFLQKLFNKNEYFFTQFSLSHLTDFLKGCLKLTNILKENNVPELLKTELETIQQELEHRLVPELIKIDNDTPFKALAHLSFRARREIKSVIQRLMAHYARLDAWQSMARATANNKWSFPSITASGSAIFQARGLYHPLLKNPVSYDLDLESGKSFLLLTGANMSGKTTFMRSIGVAALLAHLGMGVPAQSLHIGFLDGVITNMHVEDNILKGESYFFAEVQRMKHTALKVQQDSRHLVLMDELFKGTNVHDAYECTRAVIEGLLNKPQHLMILSTHLYEVAQHFSTTPNIQFAYFVTEMTENHNYNFRYELKKGISDDRIGYKILQQEGVIDILKNKQ